MSGISCVTYPLDSLGEIRDGMEEKEGRKKEGILGYIQ